MAKKRISDKDMRELRKAKREIRREINKSLSAKDKKDMEKFKCYMKYRMREHGCGGAIYGLGFLGALVYYITNASSLWAAFVGFFQALLWPAFLVHGVLTFIGA